MLYVSLCAVPARVELSWRVTGHLLTSSSSCPFCLPVCTTLRLVNRVRTNEGSLSIQLLTLLPCS